MVLQSEIGFGRDAKPSLDISNPDAWVERRPELVKLTGVTPFNCEAPLQLLMADGEITSCGLHYVRNHGNVPKITWESHTLTVYEELDASYSAPGSYNESVKYSMDDLVNLPVQRSIPVLLVCAGNRRKEQNMKRATIGFNWGSAGCSTSMWTGVPLWALLELSGYSLDQNKSKMSSSDMRKHYVWFEGVEKIGNKGIYGTSVPLMAALDRTQDMMVAYAMNDERLPPDHGYPLRVILPGYIGGRMVKWLCAIRIKSYESDNYWHVNDNRVLPTEVLSREIAEQGGWWKKPEYVINHLNIQSVITKPAHAEELPVPDADSTETYLVQGYAYTGGGKRLIRVELSIDHGETWLLAELHHSDKTGPTEYGKQWCWIFWSCPVLISELISKGLSATEVQFCVRAWDDSMNTQPKYMTWNLMGMMNNPWHRVFGKIDFSEEKYVFQHPTNHTFTEADKQVIRGWMDTKFDLPWMNPTNSTKLPSRKEVNPVLKQPLTAKAADRVYTMAEVAKHNRKEDCWIIVEGFIYDCSRFMDHHPGGATAIMVHAGKDCTDEFHDIHSSASSYQQLFTFCVGKVAMDIATIQHLPYEDTVGARTPVKLDVARWQVVVVGNGMVGQRFCEKLRKNDPEGNYQIICVGEESRRHYNRMRLTEYFDNRDEGVLYLADESWYTDEGVTVKLNQRVDMIDIEKKQVTMENADCPPISYDYLVMATGSYAFLPPVPGHKQRGVFVYRTLTDLDEMLMYVEDNMKCENEAEVDSGTSCSSSPIPTSIRSVQVAAVVGGGLLGLEAAKALLDQGLTVYVVERSSRLMNRQLDQDGAKILQKKVEALGVRCITGKRCKEILGDKDERVTGLDFGEGDDVLDVQMVVFATGVRPRTDLAQKSGIAIEEAHKGGGIIVDDNLATDVPGVYAIGECVNHMGKLYGLVAPGYHMAEVLAWRMIHRNAEILLDKPSDDRVFTGSDMSTRLKLLGVDVAVFGDFCPDIEAVGVVPLVYKNPMEGVYRKLYFTSDGKHLTGGILVGDASDYSQLLLLVQSKSLLQISPGEVLVGKKGDSEDMPLADDALVCFCNNVTKGEIVEAITEENICDLEDLKACTKAGTGCGGCVPTVKTLLSRLMTI
ncbi:hypothetical protein SARC_08917 [Sphaeroforma arctica JP610]|uniref:Cytochrome b5 heme-binding domain-containing protein n=1 Tax=Sphaeroforma arctica JP610 TaxID=667725 RepID=A0A0L0FPM4_9EUKA|nr:hypothetical protein SARC_08917 [Sphaeroforma arctica JP610]KNC78659.1 hypothetical protein SARC_08917 [Sphaeroforma arctica JP610]|eukprot:XP_014152561.1 hypothetical protein SARC_08917 [Sphaeroforma arctica JP610]